VMVCTVWDVCRSAATQCDDDNMTYLAVMRWYLNTSYC